MSDQANKPAAAAGKPAPAKKGNDKKKKDENDLYIQEELVSGDFQSSKTLLPLERRRPIAKGEAGAAR